MMRALIHVYDRGMIRENRAMGGRQAFIKVNHLGFLGSRTHRSWIMYMSAVDSKVPGQGTYLGFGLGALLLNGA
jgi:hypothetical protein